MQKPILKISKANIKFTNLFTIDPTYQEQFWLGLVLVYLEIILEQIENSNFIHVFRYFTDFSCLFEVGSCLLMSLFYFTVNWVYFPFPFLIRCS
jgi:hypothetical protein